MKTDTLRALLIARNLFDQVDQLTVGDDPYSASAALVILQDAVELSLLAALIEIEADHEHPLEKVTFDQMIGLLRAKNILVPKSGTLKAMNKARVIVKHYGQLSEFQTVSNFYNVSKAVIDTILEQVIGTDLIGVTIGDFLSDGDAKQFIQEAAIYIKENKYYESMVEIRKALFLEIESDYVVEEWNELSTDGNWLVGLGRQGWKAPHYTKSKEWIEKNVREPFDYVQIDHRSIKVDLMEWGINTQDFWNVWRLTPSVYRSPKGGDWLVKFDQKFSPSNDDCRYCLDRTTRIILRKQNHRKAAKWYSTESLFEIVTTDETSLYEKSSEGSPVTATLPKGKKLLAGSYVEGLDGKSYYYVTNLMEDGDPWFTGYVNFSDCASSGG